MSTRTISLLLFLSALGVIVFVLSDIRDESPSRSADTHDDAFKGDIPDSAASTTTGLFQQNVSSANGDFSVAVPYGWTVSDTGASSISLRSSFELVDPTLSNTAASVIEISPAAGSPPTFTELVARYKQDMNCEKDVPKEPCVIDEERDMMINGNSVHFIRYHYRCYQGGYVLCKRTDAIIQGAPKVFYEFIGASAGLLNKYQDSIMSILQSFKVSSQ